MGNEKALKGFWAALVAAAIAACAFLAGFCVRGCAAEKESRSLSWALDVINKNYYFGGVDGGDFTGYSLDAAVDKYLDRYSEYYTAEEYKKKQKEDSGLRSGIGVSYSFVAGKGVFISNVVGNSPAYKSGLRAGEWIVGAELDGAQYVFGGKDDFPSLISSAGAGRNITLKAADGAQYSVHSAEYTAAYAKMATNGMGWAYVSSEDGGLALTSVPNEAISYLPQGAAYLRLDRFSGSAAEQFYGLIEKFNSENLTSLILDLRGNGGGFVSILQDIAGCFAQGTAMTAVYRDGGRETFACTPVRSSRKFGGEKLYIIADAGTASASEALMGVLISYGVTDYGNIFLSDYSAEYLNWVEASGEEVKTRRTYGKGIMQSTFVNESTGEALTLTTAGIFWPNGNGIHERGITAEDGCISVAAEWQFSKDDKQLKDVIDNIKSR